jgi:hypothetical protein
VEPTVLSLLLVMVVLAVVLTAALWFGTVFLQSYFYTEPSGGVAWQAPLAAALLTGFFLFWSLVNVWGGTLVDGRPDRPDLPYDVLWKFSNRIYLTSEPVAQFESKKRLEGDSQVCVRDKVAGPYTYKLKGGTDRWGPEGVEWIKLTHDGQQYTFKPVKQEGGGYRVFVNDADGWELREIEMGRPTKTSFGRLLMYFFLNALHLLMWVVCIWLVLRFAPGHAVGLALALWLLFTLAVLPGLCSRAAAALVP